MGVTERKEREKESRRQEILKAGEELFIKQGVQNTTMEQIANQVEISRATLYLYFKSKEELFFTIVLKALNILYDMMKEKSQSEVETEKKLIAIGRGYLEFYKINRNYFKLINYMNDSEHPAIGYSFDELSTSLFKKSNDIWDLIVSIIETGKNEGIIKDSVDSFEMAIMLWSSSNGIIQIIDHFKFIHNELPPDFPPEVKFLGNFYGINPEKMLNTLWDMILKSIRK